MTCMSYVSCLMPSWFGQFGKAASVILVTVLQFGYSRSTVITSDAVLHHLRHKVSKLLFSVYNY